VIRSFGNQLADDLFHDLHSAATRQFAADLRRAVQRKLQYLHAAGRLQDLGAPPGNRLEALKGRLKGHYSIRINAQWRVIFKWEDGGASDVRIVDYH
jgi:proteic killer suppression protein